MADLNMAYKWNRFAACWTVDIQDADGNALLNGVPLVTGADLFSQFGYMEFGGQLIAQTDGDPTAVPTFENLGKTGHVYFIASP